MMPLEVSSRLGGLIFRWRLTLTSLTSLPFFHSLLGGYVAPGDLGSWLNGAQFGGISIWQVSRERRAATRVKSWTFDLFLTISSVYA